MARLSPRLAGLLAAQAGAVAAVVVYGAVLGQPMAPDDGLRQFDALTLAEPVAGLDAVAGLPTLVLATGSLAGEEAAGCPGQVRRALADRAAGEGLPLDYALVLLVPDPPGAAGVSVPDGLAATELRPDAGGALARALALPRAADGCFPGYAVVDPDGLVRYRTYDPGWPRHTQQQTILLDAAARDAR